MDELGVGEGQDAVGADEEVPVGRRDVDGAGQRDLFRLGELHPELGATGEDLGEHRSVPGVEVLDDQHRYRQIGAQGPE